MTTKDSVKRLVRERARGRCEYCHSPERISTSIIGITPTGRATCERLDMNDDRYQGERSIMEARALWVQAGWHPPDDDPRQAD